jgi:hypothetical protein
VTYIDSALLNLTEWLCRRFQLLTGRTNVWLALQLTNLSIIVYFVWAGVYFWSSDVVSQMALALFCGGLLYVLSLTIFKVPIEAYEESAYRRVAKGFRNPRRVRDALLRISFLTLSLVLFSPILFVYVNLRAYIAFHVHITLVSYSLIVLTTVVLYLLACDPLPPCAGTVREWLRGSALSRSREELPVDGVKVGGLPSGGCVSADTTRRDEIRHRGRVRRGMRRAWCRSSAWPCRSPPTPGRSGKRKRLSERTG